MNADLFPSEDPSWSIVNESNMDGRSLSRITRTERGTWHFAGRLSQGSIEGFTSIRSGPHSRDLSSYDGISMRVMGDGRLYRLSLRTRDDFEGVVYQVVFATVAGAWVNVHLPFEAFEPTRRGHRAPEAGRLDTTDIHQVGFMIADGREGDFSLEIAWIRVLKISAAEA